MRIKNDPRKIKSINRDCGETDHWSYFIKDEWNKNGVDEIIPYLENGSEAPLTWFEIIKNGNVIARVNGLHVTSVYYL